LELIAVPLQSFDALPVNECYALVVFKVINLDGHSWLLLGMLRPVRRQCLRCILKTGLVMTVLLVSVPLLRSSDMNEVDDLLSCPYPSTTTSDRILFDETSDYIRHYPEFICPQNFRNLADWIYGWPETAFNEELEDVLKTSRATIRNLPHGSIIYVKTDQLPSFFANTYPILRHQFVLITGQGGTQTPGDYVRYLESTDTKIIHWFAQNGDIDAARSDRFTHIPVGRLRTYDSSSYESKASKGRVTDPR
jgi:hypothetical protein